MEGMISRESSLERLQNETIESIEPSENQRESGLAVLDKQYNDSLKQTASFS